MSVTAAARTAPRLDTRLPVLLLRTDHNPFHHGTLAAIRSLGRAGVPVHAVLEGPGVPAAHSRHLHLLQPWGPAPTRPDHLLGHLRAIAAGIGTRALLVPLDDAGAIFMAEHGTALCDHFVFPRQRPDAPRLVADKSALADACRAHGITSPDSRTPATAAELHDAVADLGLPLIAKWARPWALPPGHRSTTVVRDAAEAHRLLAESRGATGAAAGALILQRRVGADGGDWFFQGYFDEHANCLYGGTGRKHLAYPRARATRSSASGRSTPTSNTSRTRSCRSSVCGAWSTSTSGSTPTPGRTTCSTSTPARRAVPALPRPPRPRPGPRHAPAPERARRARPRPRHGRALLVENHYLQRALTAPAAELFRPGGCAASAS
ncbi:ATP-grasp domain-containing protein [Actinomadura sp. J1-007]|uniref:ATP-grasp domain-containing protein n=1 Tax=Actinomadura sp. J1-007 TaxID=2661913 RepID=UPI00132C9756|nr:ATP-grasp domain-containing protein [Actinomadura sp. J1-007]MWK35087.1 ATP-grasp domain-containing protein [Actinomadura sp. J1-007]